MNQESFLAPEPLFFWRFLPRHRNPPLSPSPPCCCRAAAFAQAKPEVASATKAAKRAWESAPEEKALAAAAGGFAHRPLRGRSGRSSSRVARRSRWSTHIRPRRCWRTTGRCFASGTSATAVMRGRWLATKGRGFDLDAWTTCCRQTTRTSKNCQHLPHLIRKGKRAAVGLRGCTLTDKTRRPSRPTSGLHTASSAGRGARLARTAAQCGHHREGRSVFAAS